MFVQFVCFSKFRRSRGVGEMQICPWAFGHFRAEATCWPFGRFGKSPPRGAARCGARGHSRACEHCWRQPRGGLPEPRLPLGWTRDPAGDNRPPPPGLPLVSELQREAGLLGLSGNSSVLKRVDDSDIQGSVKAGVPVGDEDVCRPLVVPWC